MNDDNLPGGKRHIAFWISPTESRTFIDVTIDGQVPDPSFWGACLCEIGQHMARSYRQLEERGVITRLPGRLPLTEAEIFARIAEGFANAVASPGEIEGNVQGPASPKRRIIQ